MKRTELTCYLHRITYLSSDGNYTYVHFSDNSKTLFARTLAVCLLDLPGFIRVHRKFAVNPAFVGHLDQTTDTVEIVLSDKRLPVSRRQVKLVKAALSKTGSPVPEKPKPIERPCLITNKPYTSIGLAWH